MTRTAAMPILLLTIACGDDSDESDAGTDATRADAAMMDASRPVDAADDAATDDAATDGGADDGGGDMGLDAPATDAALCPSAELFCGDACIDPETDPMYCGACDIECATGASCSTGTCTCPALQPDVCDDTCVDASSDEANCGDCGVACEGDEQCVGGTCFDRAIIGCADGQREGFSDTALYPSVASCSGGFSVMGVASSSACSAEGGDDGDNPTGVDCSIADLCAPGWHVCATPSEFDVRNAGAGCTDAVETGVMFFATQTTGGGFARCDFLGDNDLFGCGTMGGPATHGTCTPLDRTLAHNSVPWDLGSSGFLEALSVTKSGPEGGGALCCMDTELITEMIGCADGQREGLTDIAAFPDIAACDGGFDIAGIRLVDSEIPQCSRGAGDDGANPNGTGCNVADFCAPGWEVCATAAQALSSGLSDCSEAVEGAGLLFYATRQSGPGSRRCNASGTNDIFGCGNVGSAPMSSSCMPFDRYLSSGAIVGDWRFGPSSSMEAAQVTKPGVDGGGVLCCRSPS